MYVKTEGIVLREVEFNDADKLLDLLTKDQGLLTVKARGVRRKNSTNKTACQLLCYGEFTLFDYRGRMTINEAVPIEQFTELRGDIELLSLGSYFAQAAGLIAQSDVPTPELLSLLLNALYALGRLKKPQLLVKGAFELRLAALAGFEPDLSGCVTCGRAEPDRFLVRQGVLQCASCQGADEQDLRLPITPGVLAAMRHILWCDSKKLFSFTLSEASLEQLSGITETFLSTQLEHSFYTLDFYKSLFLTYGE